MKRIFLILAFFALAFPALRADDPEAIRLYEEGYALYQAGKFYDAAKKFEEVDFEATSPLIRSNALRAQAGAWQMCGMFTKEYEVSEKLLSLYPEFADSDLIAQREFELAERYYAGERDPAYWHFRWIPWLNNGDKSLELYTSALKHAPFAEWAPQARLRRAWLLDEDDKKKESVEELRILVRDYTTHALHKYAMLALANGLFNLSEHGDGDGAYLREAYQVLLDFQKRYPDASENEWVRRRLLHYRDAQAQRLFDMATYYRKQGRTDAAERYLAKVLIDYPDAGVAPDSEAELVKLDENYIPVDFPPESGARLPKLRTYEIPADANRTLLNPGENGNHYLLAVPDLRIPHGEDKAKEENEEK